MQILTPWNLSSYIPFGGFSAALEDWMLGQLQVDLVRPEWPHERPTRRSAAGVSHPSGKNRLASLFALNSVRTVLNIDDLELIQNTPGDFEFHYGIPFSPGGRSFIIFIDTISELFLPFIFDESDARRRDFELALPIFEELLAADECAAIVTPYHETKTALHRTFGSTAIDGKVRLAPPSVRFEEAAPRVASGPPVFLGVSRPPVYDAFGRSSPLSVRDTVVASWAALSAFAEIRRHRSDARLLWLSPDWHSSPARWSKEENPAFSDNAAAASAVETVARLIADGAVVPLDLQPNPRELLLLMRRSDFLLDFSPGLDRFAVLLAMQNGCIPILPNLPQTREIGGGGDLSVRFDDEVWRHNPHGFIEGFASSSRCFETMNAAIETCCDAVLDLIENPSLAGARRSAMRKRVATDFMGYGSGNFQLAEIARRIKPAELRYSERIRPVTTEDFSVWQAPTTEHEFDGLEIVSCGQTLIGRLPNAEPGPFFETGVGKFSSDRFDAVVQNFTKRTIFGQEAIFKKPGFIDPAPVWIEHFDCAVDEIGGAEPGPIQFIGGELIDVYGWTVLSGSEGTLPDAVYVSLTRADGDVAYVKARRVERMDIVRHFGHPKLRFAGFRAQILTDGLQQRVTLGLARKVDGRIERYRGIKVHLVLMDESEAIESPVQTAGFGNGPPPGAEITAISEIEGSIDSICGEACANTCFVDDRLIEVQGWTAVSPQEGVIPDAVYLTLTNANGERAFIPTYPYRRPDLVEHFEQPRLRYAGFAARILIGGLDEDLTLGLARLIDERLEICVSNTILLRVRPQGQEADRT